ncbi:MAG: RNA-guided pseudouridylation complex pseudouridine synthase subunit Cbf5 [Candidatus Nanoarchaeia archaeon]|jgi:H/ACA ribonucleoprotein complex subunit 4
MMIKRKPYEERSYPERTMEELMQCSMVIIDKPKGPFSYEITDAVKQALNARKTGHAGTLDPNATGVLAIGVNKGCHVLQAIGHAPKEYVGLMRVHTDVSMSKIINTAKKFVGTITQLPPVRSAVKREERERDIYSLKVLDVTGREVKFRVSCQAGTYIRKLCTEWGDAMDSKAHLQELIRTKAGPYTLDDTVQLDVFLKNPNKYLIPVETAVTQLPHLWVDDNTIKTMKNGAQPFLPGVYKYDSGIKVGDLIAIMTPSQELAAIGKSLMSEQELKGSKGQIVKLERVFL